MTKMRINIEIDDELLAEVMGATGIRSKQEAVEIGLKALLRQRNQQDVRLYRGNLDWQGDLEDMRTDN